jgi:hypothetical protein
VTMPIFYNRRIAIGSCRWLVQARVAQYSGDRIKHDDHPIFRPADRYTGKTFLRTCGMVAGTQWEAEDRQVAVHDRRCPDKTSPFMPCSLVVTTYWVTVPHYSIGIHPSSHINGVTLPHFTTQSCWHDKADREP